MQPSPLSTTSGDTKRFTTRRKNLEFYVDEDHFVGVPALPAMTALELTKMHGEIQQAEGTDKLSVIMEVFKQFLETDSYERFVQRLSDKTNPIDLPTLLEVIQWILGEGVGLRPTQKPSPSDTGPTATGPASTDGALPGMSIPEISTGVDSST